MSTREGAPERPTFAGRCTRFGEEASANLNLQPEGRAWNVRWIMGHSPHLTARAAIDSSPF